ncbi:MAG TPA: hypothetical protein VFS33_01105 [Gemmatimonadales bacterium]|nr:hypothetical protein [Gemmatimonadales bacterium]
MITRRDTLEQALGEVETGALAGASSIVVSRSWWDHLSTSEQDAYRRRAERAAIELRADEAMRGHFVEVRGGDEGAPLSTERPM